MKQIKTIKNRLDNAEMFDNEVNRALKEGWRLTKRDVIRPNAHPHNGEIAYTVLYAELEKETIAEAERRSCYHCKWHFKTCNSEPCRHCNNGDRWEP